MALIDSQKSGGTLVNLHWDEHDETLHVERWQDAEPILERNKALAAQHFDGYNAARDMKAIAEVPFAILEQWRKEGITLGNPDHDNEVMKRLNDPALRGFRMDTPVAHGGIIIKGTR